MNSGLLNAGHLSGHRLGGAFVHISGFQTILDFGFPKPCNGLGVLFEGLLARRRDANQSHHGVIRALEQYGSDVRLSLHGRIFGDLPIRIIRKLHAIRLIGFDGWRL